MGPPSQTLIRDIPGGSPTNGVVILLDASLEVVMVICPRMPHPRDLDVSELPASPNASLEVVVMVKVTCPKMPHPSDLNVSELPAVLGAPPPVLASTSHTGHPSSQACS